MIEQAAKGSAQGSWRGREEQNAVKEQRKSHGLKRAKGNLLAL